MFGILNEELHYKQAAYHRRLFTTGRMPLAHAAQAAERAGGESCSNCAFSVTFHAPQGDINAGDAGVKRRINGRWDFGGAAATVLVKFISMPWRARSWRRHAGENESPIIGALPKLMRAGGITRHYGFAPLVTDPTPGSILRTFGFCGLYAEVNRKTHCDYASCFSFRKAGALAGERCFSSTAKLPVLMAASVKLLHHNQAATTLQHCRRCHTWKCLDAVMWPRTCGCRNIYNIPHT